MGLAGHPALIAAASLTLIYVAALLFYPHRDVLILWERNFSAPRGLLLALGLALAGYTGGLWRLLHPTLDNSKRQTLGHFALFIAGGLTIQLLATAITEGDPFAGIARRTLPGPPAATGRSARRRRTCATTSAATPSAPLPTPSINPATRPPSR